MERSLGSLSAAVRSKDAEIASLQNAMHEQFAERNSLRAQLSGVDSQLVRLQGSYVELEARFRDSEEACARLQAAQERCGYLDILCLGVLDVRGCSRTRKRVLLHRRD
jgi:chromosome segregation ATPase